MTRPPGADRPARQGVAPHPTPRPGEVREGLATGLTLAQAAAAIGYSKWWFYKHRATLQREQGFPKPMPGTNRWDPLAIEAWKQRDRQRQGLEDPTAAAPEIDYDAELERRALRIVQGGRR